MMNVKKFLKINTKKLLQKYNKRKQNARKLLIKKAGEKMNNPIDIIKSKCYPFARGIAFAIAPNGELKYHSGSSVVLRDEVISSKEALDAVMTLPAINEIIAVEELTAKNGSKYYKVKVKLNQSNKVKKFITFENDPSILIELLKRAQRRMGIEDDSYGKISYIKFKIEF